MLSSARAAARLLRSQYGRAGFAALQAARGQSSSRVLTSKLKLSNDVQARTISCIGLQSRTFAASASPDDAPTLEEVVQEELEYERSVADTIEPIPTPPSGWTLTQEDGSSILRLARTYEDEQIIITIDINPKDDEPFPKEAPDANFDATEEGSPAEEQPLPEDGEEIDSELILDFEVEIQRRGDKLRIEALFDGDTIDIQHIGHGPHEQGKFDGPDYASLDPGVQQAFIDYLGERGIDSDMGEYLMTLHDAKEQKEYLHWLTRLNKFLAK